MKIICIGRNYVKHIQELNNEIPDEPVIFTKPDTAIVRNGDPFMYPEFSSDIHYEVELFVRINRVGKYIQEQFAHKYYDQFGIGIDFTARDLQQKAKEKGLPWAIAKGFNGSAPISKLIPINSINSIQDISFSLEVNGEERQKSSSKLMMYTVDQIISYVSKFMTLKKGDLIFTGTPEGVGPVKMGDKLAGFIEGKKYLEVEVK